MRRRGAIGKPVKAFLDWLAEEARDETEGLSFPPPAGVAGAMRDWSKQDRVRVSWSRIVGDKTRLACGSRLNLQFQSARGGCRSTLKLVFPPSPQRLARSGAMAAGISSVALIRSLRLFRQLGRTNILGNQSDPQNI